MKRIRTSLRQLPFDLIVIRMALIGLVLTLVVAGILR